eukprot:1161025-Pelagomonas_calceolata.AAC.12
MSAPTSSSTTKQANLPTRSIDANIAANSVCFQTVANSTQTEANSSAIALASTVAEAASSSSAYLKLQQLSRPICQQELQLCLCCKQQGIRSGMEGKHKRIPLKVEHKMDEVGKFKQQGIRSGVEGQQNASP